MKTPNSAPISSNLAALGSFLGSHSAALAVPKCNLQYANNEETQPAEHLQSHEILDEIINTANL